MKLEEEEIVDIPDQKLVEQEELSQAVDQLSQRVDSIFALLNSGEKNFLIERLRAVYDVTETRSKFSVPKVAAILMDMEEEYCYHVNSQKYGNLLEPLCSFNRGVVRQYLEIHHKIKILETPAVETIPINLAVLEQVGSMVNTIPIRHFIELVKKFSTAAPRNPNTDMRIGYLMLLIKSIDFEGRNEHMKRFLYRMHIQSFDLHAMMRLMYCSRYKYDAPLQTVEFMLVKEDGSKETFCFTNREKFITDLSILSLIVLHIGFD